MTPPEGRINPVDPWSVEMVEFEPESDAVMVQICSRETTKGVSGSSPKLAGGQKSPRAGVLSVGESDGPSSRALN